MPILKNSSQFLLLIKKHKKFVLFVLILLISFVIVVKYSSHLNAFNPQKAKTFVLSFGAISPLIFIIIQLAQVLFAPIPGQATGFAGGYVFGWALGTLYTMIGLGIGSFIIFIFSRKFGIRFVNIFNGEEAIKDFEHLFFPPNSKATKQVNKIKEHGLLTFFLIMLLPALPDDLVCFAAGLSRIPIWQLLIATIAGRLPGMLVLSLMGDGFSKDEVHLFYILFIVFWIIVMLLYLFNKKKIENFMKNLIERIRA